MRILISNDDGYKAKGIKQLTKSLSEIAEVIVVAPSENKSAASSSLTLGRPLKPILIEKNIYSIDATPTDCVHLALCGFIKESIDLVVTGINFGANLGDDTIYSGTVAGAIEGRFLGLHQLQCPLLVGCVITSRQQEKLLRDWLPKLINLNYLTTPLLMLMFQIYACFQGEHP